jgi:hypothetical protein
MEVVAIFMGMDRTGGASGRQLSKQKYNKGLKSWEYNWNSRI